MSTGIPISSKVADEFHKLKLKHEYDYIVMRMDSNYAEVVMDKVGKKGAGHKEFIKGLPKDDCRYAVLEVPESKKLCFILWAPDSAPIKSRMTYASTKAGLLDVLKGSGKAIQAADLAEISLEAIRKEIGN